MAVEYTNISIKRKKQKFSTDKPLTDFFFCSDISFGGQSAAVFARAPLLMKKILHIFEMWTS